MLSHRNLENNTAGFSPKFLDESIVLFVKYSRMTSRILLPLSVTCLPRTKEGNKSHTAVATQLFSNHVSLNTIDSFDHYSVDFRPCLPLQF